MDHHLLLVVSANHLNTKRTANSSTRGVPGYPVAEVVADWIVKGVGVKSGVILGSHLRHGENTLQALFSVVMVPRDLVKDLQYCPTFYHLLDIQSDCRRQYSKLL